MATIQLLRSLASRIPRNATRISVLRKWTQPRRLFSVDVTLHQPDKVTHTGQSWSDNDYRNVRFIDREKEVNEQFAIDLVAEEPVVVVTGSHTWCDGGHAGLGHPKVYINLDKPEINFCGYCGRRFVSEQHKSLFPEEQFCSAES